MRKEENCVESTRQGTFYIQYKRERLTGLDTCGIGTALSMYVIEGKIDGTGRRLRRRKQLLDDPTENTENLKRKCYITHTHTGELAFGRDYLTTMTMKLMMMMMTTTLFSSDVTQNMTFLTQVITSVSKAQLICGLV